MRFSSVTAGAVVALLLGAPISAQIPAAPQAPAPPRALPAQPPPAATTAATERVTLTAGRSTVLHTDFDITRIAITNPAIADATVVAAARGAHRRQGAGHDQPDHLGRDARVAVRLRRRCRRHDLEQQLQALFPGEDIRVSANDEAIILSGNVSSNAIMLQRRRRSREATSAKSKVINMLQLPGGSESQQVMLQVRFAEVNRRALQELGVSFFTSRHRFPQHRGAASTTQQFAAPDFDNLEARKSTASRHQSGELTFSDFLNIFLFERQARHRRGDPRAAEHRASSRASPNPT